MATYCKRNHISGAAKFHSVLNRFFIVMLRQTQTHKMSPGSSGMNIGSTTGSTLKAHLVLLGHQTPTMLGSLCQSNLPHYTLTSQLKPVCNK